MAATLNRRDLLVSVAFSEEEARFLAMLAMSRLDDYTDAQAEIAQRIASKFVLAGQAKKDDLIEEHGIDAVVALAEECMDAYPDAVLGEGL